MASSHKAMDRGGSTDRACSEGLASVMVQWSDEDNNGKFTQSVTGDIWRVWTVSLRTLCPIAHPLMLHLAWDVMSISFLMHTPMPIQVWPTSSKQSVGRHEGPDQARMGHQRHIVRFHVVGQWRVSDENMQEKLGFHEMIHSHDSI